VPAELKTGFVAVTCSALFISPRDIPPIHAATTTLTATVTAMSMIDATTGLSAFEFFFIFLRYVFIFFTFCMFVILIDKAGLLSITSY